MFEPTLNQRETRLEWLMLLALFGLMIVGATFIYSATVVNESARQLPIYKQEFFKQVIFYLAGLAMAAAICLIDYRRLARWSLVAYWSSIFFLIAVFAVGVTRYGAQPWLNCGPSQSRPSEFAQLACLLA